MGCTDPKPRRANQQPAGPNQLPKQQEKPVNPEANEVANERKDVKEETEDKNFGRNSGGTGEMMQIPKTSISRPSPKKESSQKKVQPVKSGNVQQNSIQKPRNEEKEEVKIKQEVKENEEVSKQVPIEIKQEHEKANMEGDKENAEDKKDQISAIHLIGSKRPYNNKKKQESEKKQSTHLDHIAENEDDNADQIWNESRLDYGQQTIIQQEGLEVNLKL